MLMLIASWTVAKLATLATLVVGWIGLSGVISAGVILLSALVALLIHDVVREMEAKRNKGPLERGRAPWSARRARRRYGSEPIHDNRHGPRAEGGLA